MMEFLILISPLLVAGAGVYLLFYGMKRSMW